MTWQTYLGLACLALASFVLSLAAVLFLLVQLPATYFLDSHSRHLWIDQHPVIRWSGLILKNLLGGALVIVGGVLSLPGIPGQGLLTVLLGLVLLDFPGKRRLERALLRRRQIGGGINRVRQRFGKPPLELPQDY